MPTKNPEDVVASLTALAAAQAEISAAQAVIASARARSIDLFSTVPLLSTIELFICSWRSLLGG